jgi:hypothetical protein
MYHLEPTVQDYEKFHNKEKNDRIHEHHEHSLLKKIKIVNIFIKKSNKIILLYYNLPLQHV